VDATTATQFVLVILADVSLFLRKFLVQFVPHLNPNSTAGNASPIEMNTAHSLVNQIVGDVSKKNPIKINPIKIIRKIRKIEVNLPNVIVTLMIADRAFLIVPSVLIAPPHLLPPLRMTLGANHAKILFPLNNQGLLAVVKKVSLIVLNLLNPAAEIEIEIILNMKIVSSASLVSRLNAGLFPFL
jgi:hypothetical protein